MKRKKKIKPTTHSEVLWHFTGGPTWNARQQKQNKNLKLLSSSYEAFKSILKSKELRLGNYHEIINCIVPSETIYDDKAGKTKKITNVKRTIKTVSVCCVADIPLGGLGMHAERYGKMTIGFKRSSLVSAGFNPVFYTLEDREIILNYYMAQSSLELIDNGASGMVEDIGGQISDVQNQFEEHYYDLDIDVSDAMSTVEEMEVYSQEALESLGEAMAFIKTFSNEEFDTIYSEREWRSTKLFNFKYRDLDTLILPKRGGYYDDFKKKISKTLSLPKSVKLLAWEDSCD